MNSANPPNHLNYPLAVMSKYHKMDMNKYPSIFRCHIMYQTNIWIYLNATYLPNEYPNIFEGHFIQIFKYLYSSMIKGFKKKAHSCFIYTGIYACLFCTCDIIQGQVLRTYTNILKLAQGNIFTQFSEIIFKLKYIETFFHDLSMQTNKLCTIICPKNYVSYKLVQVKVQSQLQVQV